jgi:hypothetical protein
MLDQVAKIFKKDTLIPAIHRHVLEDLPVHILCQELNDKRTFMGEAQPDDSI